VWTYAKLRRELKKIWADPNRRKYRDIAITPPDLHELSLGIYAETRGTAAAIARDQRQQGLIRAARERGAALTAAE
jgi:hypothetical protein